MTDLGKGFELAIVLIDALTKTELEKLNDRINDKLKEWKEDEQELLNALKDGVIRDINFTVAKYTRRM